MLYGLDFQVGLLKISVNILHLPQFRDFSFHRYEMDTMECHLSNGLVPIPQFAWRTAILWSIFINFVHYCGTIVMNCEPKSIRSELIFNHFAWAMCHAFLPLNVGQLKMRSAIKKQYGHYFL